MMKVLSLCFGNGNMLFCFDSDYRPFYLFMYEDVLQNCHASLME